MTQNRSLVLSFGHIPLEIGGKQRSGLSQAMWRLANEINKIKSHYKVMFVSTDIYADYSKLQQTDVLGWNNRLLVKYALINPVLTVKYIFITIYLRIIFKFEFFNTLAKFIFWGNTLLIYEEEISIVHIHGVNNFAILNKLLTPKKYKIILTIHGVTGNDETQYHRTIQHKLEEAVTKNKNISSIVFVTEAIRLDFLRLYDKFIAPTSVILNGYDPLVFNVRESHRTFNDNVKINLLMIGSVSALKGQSRVLEAISLLPSSAKSKFALKIVGVDSNNIMPRLIDFARINNVELEFLGYKQPISIALTLQNVDYSILPSSSEGFGLVFLESIACGVPVILPKNLPLCQELNVLNPLNSIKIDDHLAVSIAKCLLKLCKPTNSKDEISRTIRHLIWPTIANEYITLYDLVSKR